MKINVEIEIEGTKGKVWSLEVDNNGNTRVTAPCGNFVNFTPGRKGKLFSDFVKAYKKAATAAGVFDTVKEEVVVKEEKKTEDEFQIQCSECGDFIRDAMDYCDACNQCLSCCPCE